MSHYKRKIQKHRLLNHLHRMARLNVCVLRKFDFLQIFHKFVILKISIYKIFKKNIISRNRILKCSKNIPKFEKLKFEKKMISTHMRFSTFGKCILYQNLTENLAFATRASHNFKKYLNNQNLIFQKFSAIDV